MVGKATPDRGGPQVDPKTSGWASKRTRKTQRDGHNSGVKIWSLCSVSSILSHANLSKPCNKVRGKMFLKKPSCVFILAFLSLCRCELCYTCRGQHTCAKYGEKDLHYVEEDCLKDIWCENYRQDHLANTRSFIVYKKEKEIIDVKHKRNLSFLEARKIVGSYMGENSCTTVAKRADTTNQDNKYRTLVEKLTQFKANDWPKFQEHLKELLGWILTSTSSTPYLPTPSLGQDMTQGQFLSGV